MAETPTTREELATALYCRSQPPLREDEVYAALDALSAAGLAVVPLTATDAVVDAYYASAADIDPRLDYERMVAAADLLTKEE